MHKIVMIANILLCAVTAGMAAYHPLHAEDPATTLIPIESFASLPTFDKPRLSPGGDKVAYLSGQEVSVRNLSTTEVRQVPSPEGRAVASLRWANNHILLLTTRNVQKDLGVDSTVVESKVFALNTRNMDAKWIGRPRNLSKNKWNRHVVHRDRIVDLLQDEPNHVLLQLKHKLTEGPSVYRVNIKTAVQKLVIGPHPAVAKWYSAPNGEVRFGGGFARRAQRTWRQLSRVKQTNDKWVDFEVSQWRAEYDFEALSDNPDTIYISGKTEHGTIGLFMANLEDGAILETMFAHPRFDLKGLLRNPGSGRVEGIFYIDDMPRQIFFDPQLQAVEAAIQSQLSGRRLWLEVPASSSDRIIVRTLEKERPGSYFLFDPANNDLVALSPRMDVFTEVVPPVAKHSERVSIKVADGKMLPGYLTLPIRKAGPYPMLILPPDIPGTRASAEWQYLKQFLASRGYAVLEPNHRGATGLGAEFEDAGKSQFGGLMTRDVVEATLWAIEIGHADPSRICIMGQGFAGYRALMASLETPDLFQCIVAVNAVVDLPRFKSNNRTYLEGTPNWSRDIRLTGVNDKTISPYHRADELKVPVLLIAAVDDARVPYRMSRALHSRLKKRRDDAEYIEIESGGHSMVTSESRLIMLRETERFLAKHLSKP